MRKNTESKNSKAVRTKIGRMMILSKFSVCNRKKLKFIKDQAAKGLLTNLTGIKIPILSGLPIIFILKIIKCMQQ